MVAHSRRSRILLLGGILLAPLTFSALTTVQAQPLPAASGTPGVSVIVDGKPLSFAGSPPARVNGSLLVPLRAIFEALGAQVNFANNTVRAQRGTTTLELPIGSPNAIVNGQSRTLDVPAQIVNGSTLVPLRFVGEALGAGVSYDGPTQTVTITSPPTAPDGIGTPGGTGTTEPPYSVPGSGQTITGTLLSVDNTNPAQVSLFVDGQVRRLVVAPNVLVLRQVSLAPTSTATPLRQPPRQINLAALSSGETVKVVLDNTGRATQVIGTASVVVAHVQFAGNDQIILDDERDTTLTIGPNLTYIDPQGRPATTATLTPGQNVALFISPQGRTIYRVSAYAPDYTPATAGGANTIPDPLPGAGLPPTGAPQILLVSHNATTPLKAGSRLDVTVRATTGQRLSFSLGAKIQNLLLTEDPAQPGIYRAVYIVKAGDDVLEARITARVQSANGFEATAQSQEPVTIDTVAPRLVGTFPANGAQISVSQPNIAIFADDLGGSGLGGAQIELVTGTAAAPVKQTIPATLAPPTSVNAVPTQPLSGLVKVNAVITDKAGNALPVTFAFTIGTAGGVGNPANAIRSFSHGANRTMQIGEDIPLQMLAAPNGRATFNVLSRNGGMLVRDLPMFEDANKPGRYTATYRIPDTAANQPQLRFAGRFDAGDGTVVTSEATAPVNLVRANVKLSFTSPKDGGTVTSPFTISGRGSAGATVDIALTATGTQFLVLPFSQDLGTTQVRVDDKGNWQTDPISIPTIRNVQGLKLTVTAVQTDATNKQGDPISMTVTPTKN